MVNLNLLLPFRCGARNAERGFGALEVTCPSSERDTRTARVPPPEMVFRRPGLELLVPEHTKTSAVLLDIDVTGGVLLGQSRFSCTAGSLRAVTADDQEADNGRGDDDEEPCDREDGPERWRAAMPRGVGNGCSDQLGDEHDASCVGRSG